MIDASDTKQPKPDDGMHRNGADGSRPAPEAQGSRANAEARGGPMPPVTSAPEAPAVPVTSTSPNLNRQGSMQPGVPAGSEGGAKKRGRPKGSKNKPKPDAADQPGAKKAMVTSPGADQPATKKAKTTNPVAGRAASAEAPQAQVEAATEPGGPTSLTAAPVAAGTTVEGADSVAAAGAAALQNQKRRGRPPGSKNKRKSGVEQALLEGCHIIDCTRAATADMKVAGEGVGGAAACEMRLASNSGTHLDAPALLVKDRRTAEHIKPEELTRALCVIDMSSKFGPGASNKLAMADVKAWEAEHGQVALGALVCLRTGWSPASELGPAAEGTKEGTKGGPPSAKHAHAALAVAPGFSCEVADYFLHTRQAVGLGIDTTSTDVSNSTNHFVQKKVLGADRYQLKNLDLQHVPPTGGIAVVSPLKVAGAVQVPARVVVLVPKTSAPEVSPPPVMALEARGPSAAADAPETAPAAPPAAAAPAPAPAAAAPVAPAGAPAAEAGAGASTAAGAAQPAGTQPKPDASGLVGGHNGASSAAGQTSGAPPQAPAVGAACSGPSPSSVGGAAPGAGAGGGAAAAPAAAAAPGAGVGEGAAAAPGVGPSPARQPSKILQSAQEAMDALRARMGPLPGPAPASRSPTAAALVAAPSSPAAAAAAAPAQAGLPGRPDGSHTH